MFYAQVEMRDGIPFDVVIPNKETQEVMAEGEDSTTLKKIFLSRLYGVRLEYEIFFQLFRSIGLNVIFGEFHVTIKI
jgi:hypothetical protein